jgi:carboxymethylenebutenolidase
MSEAILIPSSNGGKIPCLYSAPAAPARRGIVLASSIWGLNSELQSVADAYAALGYSVIAPNVFWRIDPAHAIDFDFTRFDVIAAFYEASDDTEGLDDLLRAAQFLRNEQGCEVVGMLGLCHGGRLCCRAGGTNWIDAVVAYYPTDLDEHLELANAVQKPMLLHLAEIEQFSKNANATATIAEAFAGIEHVETFVCLGVKHGFDFGPPHPSFDHSAARLADMRSVLFLERCFAVTGNRIP